MRWASSRRLRSDSWNSFLAMNSSNVRDGGFRSQAGAVRRLNAGFNSKVGDADIPCERIDRRNADALDRGAKPGASSRVRPRRRGSPL